MELSRFCILFINCVIIVCYVEAKPFSINEAIAAEAKLTASSEITTDTPKKALHRKIEHSEETTKIKSPYIKYSPTHLKYRLRKKFKKATDFFKPKSKTTSPLNYRQRFKINAPVRPKSKRALKPRLTRNKQARKRDTTNVEISEKYVPLLRNLGFLFDNILGSDELDSDEARTSTRFNRNSGKNDDLVCTCVRKSKSDSQKKTTPTPSPLAAEVSSDWEDQTEAASETAHHTASRNVSSLRQNTNLPTISTRDTSSDERDDHGIGERSRAALHRGLQRNISRYHGNSKHNSRRKGNNTHAAHDEKDTDNIARDGASSGELDGRFEGGNDSVVSNEQIRVKTKKNFNSRYTTKKVRKPKVQNKLRHSVDRLRDIAVEASIENEISSRDIGTVFEEHKVKDNFADRGKETKHPEFVGGQQVRAGLDPTGEVSYTGWSVQSKEDHAQSNISITEHIASDQRLSEGDGASAPENKEIRTTDEAVIAINELSQPMTQSKDGKAVVIIDGYSRTTRGLTEDKS